MLKRKVLRTKNQLFATWLMRNSERFSDLLGIEAVFSEIRVNNFNAAYLIGKDFTSDCPLIVYIRLSGAQDIKFFNYDSLIPELGHITKVWMFSGKLNISKNFLDQIETNNLCDLEVGGRNFVVEVAQPRQLFSSFRPVWKLIRSPQQFTTLCALGHNNFDRRVIDLRFKNFWEYYLKQLDIEFPGTTKSRYPSCTNYLGVASFGLEAYLRIIFLMNGEVGVEVVIDSGDYQRNEKVFGALFIQRTLIESRIGRTLSWQLREDGNICRIRLAMQGSIDIPQKHKSLVSDLIHYHVIFERVFGDLIIRTF